MSRGKNISLIETGNIISNEEEIALFVTIFFANTMSKLNIPAIKLSHSNLQDAGPILAIVDSYDKHSNIERIKNNTCNSFSAKPFLAKLIRSLII